MQHRVGRAAERHYHRDGVLERLLGEDVAGGDAAAQQLDDGLTAATREPVAPAVGRRRCRAARQRHAERLGGAGHGVSGVHAAACPFAGADCPLDGIDVGATHQTARARSDRLEGVNDGDVSFATVGELGPAGQNRARVEEHRRQIQSCGGHQHSGQRFVASGQQHRTVESFGLHHDFDAVGDHLTGNQREVHPLMTHGDAVRNRDRAELKRIAAGRKHPLLDRVGQPVQ
ncbi:Uncharacterised protein [Mycobacterium tuberculosis]|uniref:Uncharacterized protein n=1 Tax=Mycobacterium tuberculosis TaxID=1773 RepID=A0A654ZXE3_MYCTX|nr:Uncharacterised protein [Mycobacterium tuberculosis]CFS60939.1 Uncharacterised protein [Mycobacterium tuberculosis]CKR30865.1 Uncharacterised protein [Mycobacterium tuberculosis]CKR65388.1 Uncharacterised protein [Mycobacterium tuberculosis]CKR72810.1 Uncharacterised protein [Mycobacterium tuberculosis]